MDSILTVYVRLLASIAFILDSWRIIFAWQSKEPLLESHDQCSNGSLLLHIPLKVLDPPLSETVASSAVTAVVTIDTLQSLHLLHNLHRILLYQSLVGQHVLLLGAAVQVSARQDVRNGSKSANKQLECLKCNFVFNCSAIYARSGA